jgi:peptidoglycan-associated lipoprotein
MSRQWKSVAYIVCVVMVAVAIQGCKGRGQEPLAFDQDAVGPATPPPMDTGDGRAQPDVDLASLLFDRAAGLQTVYFDYDDYSLRPDALATLSENARKINEVPGVMIQLAGHCDERGTQEYNLALGERRALAVRNHLIQLGVPSNRLVTISYGHEFPAAMGSNEQAWAQNRRVEFNQAAG